MGTIIFVILRLAGLIDTRMDWVILCFLLSIDTIGLTNLITVLKKK